METVIVALVVGTFGGFAGAAAGPYLGHIFNAWERRDVRRERRHEHLREMLEEAVQATRRYHRAAFRIHVQKTIAKDFPTLPQANGFDAFMEVSSILAEPARVSWQPYRLEDETLKVWAHELNERGNGLNSRLGGIAPFKADDQWWQGTTMLLDEIEALAHRIILRLDELAW